MEPPLKRLRLFEPDESGPSIAYDSDNYSDLYDDEDTALEAEEDGQEEEEDEDVEQADPDVQLEQTRAQLDLKLKSKFEAIFEKYGRDFTDIGDEIDLVTGEIVVDNGHLLEMEDERDDGTGRLSLLEAFTLEPDGVSTETEDDESDEVHESHVKLEDMEEDDMILFQTSGVPSGRPETPQPRSGLVRDLLPGKHEDDETVAALKTSYPSESEILAQFGQELGPKIARYVSQQRAQDDSAIEPAWQTPGLPLATPGKRPILKSILLRPDSDRSSSPKGSSSVWAPKMPRGRPRRDGADVAAVFRGETIIRDRTWYSSGYVSTTVTKQRTERVAQTQSKGTMSVPLNQTLTTGKSKLELSPWTQSKQIDSKDIYGLNNISDEEPDSSEEKVAKFYKPRRSWSNPCFPAEGRASGNLNLHSTQLRHSGKGGLSSKGSRGPYVPFTEADDDALLEWVEEALKKGFSLWSPTHWKLLAEKNPRHSYLSWKDRYRRRFWQKGAIPSIGETDPGETLRDGGKLSQVVRQTEIDSQSELDDYSSSDESSSEKSQDVPSTSSRTFLGNASTHTDPRKDSKLETIDLEVLDPALRPYVARVSTEPEEPESLWQQPSKLSEPPTVGFKRGVSVPYKMSDGISAVEGSRSSSLPQMVGFRAEGPSFSSPEGNGRTHAAMDINEDDHKVVIEGSNTASGIEGCQIMKSTDGEMVTKRDNKSQGGQTLQQIPHKAFDASYNFSDEDEDEIEPVQPCRPFHFQASGAVTNRYPVKTQIIDLTMEDSTPIDNITFDRQALKSPHRKGHQSPISISSSSSASDLSESEEVKFFLQPSTPTPPVSESHMTLSGILGPDNFEELRKSSPAVLKQSPQEKTTVALSQETRNVPSIQLKSSPIHNPTPKRRTPISTNRASTLRRSMEASLSSSIIETPGGSKKRCGENGFRCGKGFCFKCLSE